MDQIHRYYQDLAPRYDQDRFDNSYGRYVDGLERHVLDRWLRDSSVESTVDIACGTGRFLDYAQTGVDVSSAMLGQAAAKWPDRRLIEADAADTGLPSDSFQSAICFHLLMHLDRSSTRRVLDEVARIVRSGGSLIFDIPSRPRRMLSGRTPSGWHGDQSIAMEKIRSWTGPEWHLQRWNGILFFPVHRVPSGWRDPLAGADRLIGRTPLARWSSYYICELKRL